MNESEIRPDDPGLDESIPSADAALLPLFDETGRAAFGGRLATLSGDDPEAWDAIAFPVELAVELAAVCNLKCVMCPVPTTIRPKTLMQPDLFRAVVDEVAEKNGFVFLPQGFGETMLHKQWAELIGHAVERGVRPIVMLTNATLLNDTNIDRLLDLEIDVLLISIDGVKPETYASLRVGGDLNKVEANVRRLVEERGDRAKPQIVMRIIRMQETQDEIEEFFERWQPMMRDDDLIQINEYNDWAGKVDDHSVDGPGYNPDDKPRSPCRMLWRNLSVHADGKVSACCHDSEDELIVGDLNQGETLTQIWNGEELQRMRRIHLEGRYKELPICLSCKNWY